MTKVVIDYIKCRLCDSLLESLYANPHLDFDETYNRKTGEEVISQSRKFRDLRITIRGSHIELRGSLHKFKNYGFHNHDGFKYSQFKYVLMDFKSLLGIDPARLILQNLEFGVNLSPPIPTRLLLSSLICHKSKLVKDQEVSNGDYKSVNYQQYQIKIYDKALQYKLSNPTMRFEVKYRKMNYINSLGVTALTDLLNRRVWKKLGRKLQTEWGNLLLVDPTIRIDELSKYQREVKLLQWGTKDYWSSSDAKTRCERKKKYKQVINLHSENVHKRIYDEMGNVLTACIYG